jgi:hypothetical protein
MSPFTQNLFIAVGLIFLTFILAKATGVGMFDEEFLKSLGFSNTGHIAARLNEDLQNELADIEEKENAKYQSEDD